MYLSLLWRKKESSQGKENRRFMTDRVFFFCFGQGKRNETLLLEARWKVRLILHAKSGSGFVNYFYGGKLIY